MHLCHINRSPFAASLRPRPSLGALVTSNSIRAVPGPPTQAHQGSAQRLLQGCRHSLPTSRPIALLAELLQISADLRAALSLRRGGRIVMRRSSPTVRFWRKARILNDRVSAQNQIQQRHHSHTNRYANHFENPQRVLTHCPVPFWTRHLAVPGTMLSTRATHTPVAPGRHLIPPIAEHFQEYSVCHLSHACPRDARISTQRPPDARHQPPRGADRPWDHWGLVRPESAIALTQNIP